MKLSFLLENKDNFLRGSAKIARDMYRCRFSSLLIAIAAVGTDLEWHNPNADALTPLLPHRLRTRPLGVAAQSEWIIQTKLGVW